MLILLPLFAFLVLFANMHGRAREEDWRSSFLQAALIWGGAMTLFSEGLSLCGALTRTWVAVLWSALLLAALALGWRSGSLARAWSRVSALASAWKPFRQEPLDWADVLLSGGLAAIAGLLLAIALVSPPNNTDSLQYHMSRVMHWAQNRSLRHYATAYDPQLMHPIWTETTILHLSLLSGSERSANLVQWLSMVGCLIGVTAIADLFRVGRRGQLLCAAYAATIPIGILEASSTQTDYVASFWLVGLAYFTVLSKVRPLAPMEWFGVGLAVGLGILTKTTFYALAFPLLLWLFRPCGPMKLLRQTLLPAGIVALTVLLLNAGFWSRDYATYGSPFGSAEWINRHTRSQVNPGGVLAAWVDNLALNFPTPSEHVNSWLVSSVRRLHDLTGGESGRFSLIWGWNNENLAGNPIHLALVSVAVAVLFLVKSQAGSSAARRYALVVIASALVLFAVIAFDVYGVRYQLPFFVAAAPVVGVATTQIGKPRLTAIAGAVLLVAAFPWVLFNASRPIIGLRPRTMTDSIFLEPPVRILFANRSDLQDPYAAAAKAIKATGCRNVGLRLDSHDLEYPWWWLLQAPQSGYRLETIYTLPWLEKLIEPDFRPCAILCTICGDERTTLHGLPLVQDFGPVRLYAGPSYRPEEDG